MKRQLALLLVAALCLSLCACGSETAATPPKAEENILQSTADWLTGTITELGGSYLGSEWTVMAMARSNLEVDEGWFEDYYQSLCADTAEKAGVLDSRKYTEYSRVILALTAIGKDPTNVAGFNLLLPLADFDQTVFQGVNGAIFALLALDSGKYEIPENSNFNTQATRELYVDYILQSELSEGGWAFGSAGAGADLTAMALQALAKYRDRTDVDAVVERGVKVLSDLQGSNGGYVDYGVESCETVAQVIVALTELGIDLQDERFVKDGHTLEEAMLRFRTADGGFAHLADEEADLVATEQAFYALVAMERQAQGLSPLYTMK